TVPLGPLDAHALLGIDPAHGPFRGGSIAVLRGNGFSSQVRVWFGDVEVPHDQVQVTRADRVQVTVPAGSPGDVKLATRDGEDADTHRELANGYHYDGFYADPDTTSASGGTIITLHGSGTGWTSDTQVQLDGAPCGFVALRNLADGEQELDCNAPAGSEGEKTLSITNGDSTETVIGGVTYTPATQPQGGLSGDPIAGTLNVYVTSAGAPVSGAYVIAGTTFDLTKIGQPGSGIRQTGSDGGAQFTGDISGPTTVTVAAHCFQPLTIVHVPVDTFRAELNPVASPDCAQGQPPQFGGSPARPVTLSGELVWQGTQEQLRAPWTNVPIPAQADEARAAYVFQPGGDARTTFRLPRADSAITPASSGVTGYSFELTTGSGNRTLSARAGIENRNVSPPRFTAYALGLLQGLYAAPGQNIDGLAIVMDHTLDQALTLQIEDPTTAARGPDHLDVQAAVQISNQGFIVMPNLVKQTPLPSPGQLGLIGLPALVGTLEGAQYAVSVQAVTGSSDDLPQSILPLLDAPEASTPVFVRSFVPVPTLSVGSDDQSTWNRTLSVSWTDRGRSVDLIEYSVSSGSGLITWSVVAPPADLSVQLPDISRLPDGDLLPGPLVILASLASVPDLDYSKLTLDQLQQFSWDAYAVDQGNSRYERTTP
ncbi:MAG TPA: IPT/TIG domain-containing protein, partial [Polyangiaceae bacterium]|nr:IPT/TIG domain-containing protein [Polyangiaceae bacterium]